MAVNINILTALQTTNAAVNSRNTNAANPTLDNKGSFKNELNRSINNRKSEIKKEYGTSNTDSKVQRAEEKQSRRVDNNRIDENRFKSKELESKEQVKKDADTTVTDKSDKAEGKEDTKEIKDTKGKSGTSKLDELIKLLELINSTGNIDVQQVTAENPLITAEQLLEKINSLIAEIKPELVENLAVGDTELSTIIDSLEKLSNELKAAVKGTDIKSSELEHSDIGKLINEAVDNIKQAIKADTTPVSSKTDVEKAAEAIINTAEVKVMKDAKPIFEASKLNIKQEAENYQVEAAEEAEAATVNPVNAEAGSNTHDGTDQQSELQLDDVQVSAINTTSEDNTLNTSFGAKLEQIQSQSLDKSITGLTKADKPVEIPKTEVIEQIVKKAEVVLKAGKTEMTMKLEPENLGKLSLKIAVEKGMITAKFVAENSQVKEAIESNFNQLKDMLQQKGVAVQSFSVSVGQEGKEFNSQNNLNMWKKSMKENGRKISAKTDSSGNYVEFDSYESKVKNPYTFHEGKVDFKA